jgi:hypothetical protein
MNNLSDELIEKFNQFTEQEKEAFAIYLSNLNVSNRNKNKTEKFAKQIIEKENIKKNKYVKFIESESMNCIITAPTQVGKSEATKTLIEQSFGLNVPVIVTTDNKTDQQEQLYYRLRNGLYGADVTLIKVIDKDFGIVLDKCIEQKNKRFVIFCMDNNTQIRKLKKELGYLSIKKYFDIEKIMLIHDEGDCITKDLEIDEIKSYQAKSHKEWIELINDLKTGNIDVKRVFVSATPDNCMMLYNITNTDIINLEIPINYKGWKDIIYNTLDDDLNIKYLLKNEVDRIISESSLEVILYCAERKITGGQNIILESLGSELPCTVHTYNGDGINVIFNTNEKSDKFSKELEKYKIKFTRQDCKFTVKKISIRKFYTICKKIGEVCIVTIGKDLICRGISYVGEDSEKPFASSVMFYKPGTKMHNVGICQTIGRITGCARPDLKRVLYANEDIIENYKNYNINQEKYIKRIKENIDINSIETINNLEFNKLSRPLDRPKLKLKINMIDDEVDEVEIDVDKMARLIDSWKNVNNSTDIAKVFRKMIENDGKLESNLIKDMIGDGPMASMTLKHHSKWNLVFRKENGFHYLRDEVLEYLE